jgi:PPM family protein phosphatase
MKVSFKTDQGRRREHNEDNGAILTKDDVVLALVADGMGGHLAGEQASALAIQTIETAWKQFDPEKADQDAQWLEETVVLANKIIFEYGSTHPECKGMGTTLVAALCRNEYFTIANVGDSRGYLFKNGSEIVQVTEDHSLVNELVKAGQLSSEDARYHPRKNVVTRALGTDITTQADIRRVSWVPSQILLLCSDGLSDLVDEATFNLILSSDDTLDNKAETLINRANEEGGVDNISVTLVLHDGGGLK